MDFLFFFLFYHFELSSQSLLSWNIVAEKSVDSLMGFHLVIFCCFQNSLLAFDFDNLIIIGLKVMFFAWDSLNFVNLDVLVSLGRFSAIISLNSFLPLSLFYFFSFGTTMCLYFFYWLLIGLICFLSDVKHLVFRFADFCSVSSGLLLSSPLIFQWFSVIFFSSKVSLSFYIFCFDIKCFILFPCFYLVVCVLL